MLVREAGGGRVEIGPAGAGRKVDLAVAPDAAIDWSAFDAFTLRDGTPWPRVLRYAGADAGFFDWARRRPIEAFVWEAALPANRTIDAAAAAIQILSIVLGAGGAGGAGGGVLRLTLPARRADTPLDLTVAGALERFSAAGDLPGRLTLAPQTGPRRAAGSYVLPDMGALHGVEHLALDSAPLGRPISLAGLDRFTNLRSLSLSGSFSDLGALARQPGLEGLELRYVRDLDGLPPFDAWPRLDRFIAFNIDEEAGKRLRGQVKAREAVRPWAGHVGISQLRKASWWETEYGRPFAAWPKRNAKAANAAYDAALASLAAGGSPADAEAALTSFARAFNGMKAIETGEREDLADAVWQLANTADAARLGVTPELAQRWFDAERRY